MGGWDGGEELREELLLQSKGPSRESWAELDTETSLRCCFVSELVQIFINQSICLSTSHASIHSFMEYELVA